MESGLISIHTWRRVLGIGRDKAYAAAREGKLKAFKGGKGAWYVDVSEIHGYVTREIEARTVPS